MPAPPAPLLVAQGIEKTFDQTRALAGASVEVSAGEVHGLLGANGAGKSTLSRVISGHVRRDRGTLAWRGAALDPRSPRDALSAGIAMVMQETTLAPDLSVLENIFLPELAQPGRLRPALQRQRARDILESLGQHAALPLGSEVRRLSAAQRQLVEIAKALAVDATLIIFDEPTASLSPGEVERLFDVMTRLRAAGRALVFVSHRLEEVFAVTDRVTVMREGRTVGGSLPTASLSQSDIVRLMVGQDLGRIYAERPAVHAAGEPVLEVRHLCAPPRVRDVSFTLHRGEILGLGGLVGAGRSETLEALFGLRPHSGGEIRLHGKAFSPRRPADAIRAGIGFVPEDRRLQSIVPDFSVRENLLLGHLSAYRGFGLGYATRDARVAELLRLLGLPNERLLDANMLNFSGGMQQKIIIARWLLLDPRVLLLDEPTKGVDIVTRSSIYAMLQEVADRGAAVLVVSSDFEELLRLCSRIAVVSDGATIAEMESAVLDEAKLTLFAAPRSSMAANARLLADLSEETGGAAFWALRDGGRLFCLNRVGGTGVSDPGFVAGATPRFEETRIPAALRSAPGTFVAEPDGQRSTLMAQVHSHRGHDLGWIGLTVPGVTTPDAATIVRRVQDAITSNI
ncbi:sugar ABC transporter ATP-binding protein [Rhodopila globiformis]|uniref:ABC transporter n=1 Tax=Rhodopila globiformis TaxID=1071 RepID=A0A2S6NL46_RHOGL|nr:sugar ABC transporter ATP-binding protein [Rhodopila globiformis]PPQ35797.1 ABC transporter [Rhodopila globiformis]